MTIEANLVARIADLEQILREIRDQAEYNLEEPGNENDTLENISVNVSSVLFDDYTFDKEAYLES